MVMTKALFGLISKIDEATFGANTHTESSPVAGCPRRGVLLSRHGSCRPIGLLTAPRPASIWLTRLRERRAPPIQEVVAQHQNTSAGSDETIVGNLPKGSTVLDRGPVDSPA